MRAALWFVAAATLAGCGGSHPATPDAAAQPDAAIDAAPDGAIDAAPDAAVTATVTAISVSDLRTYALRSDGHAFVWGSGGSVLGPGQGPDGVPVRVWTDYAQVPTGSAARTFGIDPAGALWGWGQDNLGAPLTGGQIEIDPGPWISVASSVGSCAVKAGGTLWCWGPSTGGGVNDADVPTQVGTDTDWAAVIGDNSSYSWGGPNGTTIAQMCGLRTNGALWCWGSKYVHDPAGVGVQYSLAPSPVQVGAATWSSITVGRRVCGIQPDGTLWCWGSSAMDGDAWSDTPAQVGTDTWRNVSTTDQAMCAVKTDGTLWCWGYTDWWDTSAPPQQHQIGTDGDWAEVGVGAGFECARKTNGTVWCWGDNQSDELGIGQWNTRAREVAAPAPYATAAVGTSSACGIDGAGALSCWGSAYVGAGSATALEDLPVPVGATATWLDVAVGDQHSCALRSDHSVWCWGDFDGALAPHAIGTTSVVFEHVVMGSGNRACGLDASGLQWCWTGLGVPAQVDATVWTQLIAASCGIQQGGIWSCDSAQLGAGTTWTRAAEFCAIEASGALDCWGDNTYGELGVPNLSYSSTPVPVDSAATWIDVATTTHAACGIQADGTLWCWGDSSQTAGGVSSTTPLQVGTESTWTRLVGGPTKMCGARSDGSLWCWGDGLGGDGLDFRKVPAQVAVPTFN